MSRVVERFFERAQTRHPSVEQDLWKLFDKHDNEKGVGKSILNYLDGKSFSTDDLADDTKQLHNYVLNESISQYKDYYESDSEEKGFFEFVENMPNRDRIRMMEVFKDFSVSPLANGGMVTIPKREYNPELSYFSNVALDLVDFKDRVMPFAKDAALLEQTSQHQRVDAKERFENLKVLSEKSKDPAFRAKLASMHNDEDAAVPRVGKDTSSSQSSSDDEKK